MTLLKRAKAFITYEALTTVYNSLVLRHFTNCSNVWNDGNRTHIQNFFQKLINNSLAKHKGNHSREGVFVCDKTHVEFHKNLLQFSRLVKPPH